MAVYKIIRELLSSNREVSLWTVVCAGKNPTLEGKKIVAAQGSVLYSNLPEELAERVFSATAPLIKRGQSALIDPDPAGKGHTGVKKLFVHSINPSPRLIILGGGHVGAALCRLAAQLDYEITVVDDRPSFAAGKAHPDAGLLICEPFEKAFDRFEPAPSDYIVIVTRGHQHDRLCLEKALNRPAAYIGMIGSKRRVAAQLESLAAAGYSEDQLAKVHSPIGLSIGAVTEGEIALSILAEITKVRRSRSSGEVFQDQILRELERVELENSRAVLATIIRAQGSTPRKTGSQMIVFPDGALKGTIGGGCAEAEVRREALNCLDRSEPGLMSLNLTADAAAEEGMACGGLMDIYLELLPAAAGASG